MEGCCCQTWMFKSCILFICISEDNFISVRHIRSPASRIYIILVQPGGACLGPPAELPGGQSSTGKIGISVSVFCLLQEEMSSSKLSSLKC